MTLPIPIRVWVVDDSAFARKVIRAVLEESADFLVVGTSTGGLQALSVLLSSLPAEFPSAIAIVLHIPPGYTEPLAKRLERDSALKVLEAENGLASTRLLHASGARMLTQDEASSVVYGMPRSIFAAGVSNRVAPLDGIPGALMEMLGRP